tara:strand:- start:88 stop:678 length:591 start_codon:yes stop_codon:yes gene_type:complete
MRILILIFVLTVSKAYSQDKEFFKLSKGSVTVLIKDTSDYSKEYIDELLNWDLSQSYILNRDSLIVNGGFGYGLFDTGLLKDKSYTFQGVNDVTKITLEVKRINYSTVEYQIIVKQGDESNTFNGVAHGGVSVLGSESDEDDNTGIAYFCSEYSSNWKHSEVILRIDSEESNKAKVIIYGDLKIPLENCPTLSLRE